MNRADVLESLRSSASWDLIVIGGGATGLGVALDAASRGFRTVLLEARDFAHGTSSRSTKLIHGGVRTLRSGQIGLFRGSLRERQLLRRNAPGLVRDLGFVIPAYAWHERWAYGAGVMFHDLLAGGATPPSRILSRHETLTLAPNLEPTGLRGGVAYQDSQFDDASLALALAMTATAAGATVANHMQVVGLLKTHGRVTGAVARNLESGREYELHGRIVINAGGVHGDEVRRLDDPSAKPMLSLRQGAHLVLPAHFLPGNHAVLLPKTRDGRVLFAIPWRGRLLLGTTDTPVTRLDPEPRPLAAEVEYLLEHIARFLSPAPKLTDVLSMYAGLRPLVKSSSGQLTSRLTRDHVIATSPGGLLTIAGGRWTTYRQMAEDTVDRAAKLAGLSPQPCQTATLSLMAAGRRSGVSDPTRLHPALPITAGDVRRAAREEMARTVDDVLSRRTRSVILDARAAIEVAPAVARLLAIELRWNSDWERQSCEDFRAVARGYLPVAPANPVAAAAASPHS